MKTNFPLVVLVAFLRNTAALASEENGISYQIRSRSEGKCSLNAKGPCYKKKEKCDNVILYTLSWHYFKKKQWKIDGDTIVSVEYPDRYLSCDLNESEGQVYLAKALGDDGNPALNQRWKMDNDGFIISKDGGERFALQQNGKRRKITVALLDKSNRDQMWEILVPPPKASFVDCGINGAAGFDKCLSIDEGQQIAGLNFYKETTQNLRGYVLDDNGNPILDADVSVTIDNQHQNALAVFEYDGYSPLLREPSPKKRMVQVIFDI